MLAVSRQIIEGVTPVVRGEPILPSLWYWVGFELILAVIASFVGRGIGFFDSLLSDQFSRHLSVQIMRHASRLDLQTYESPAFQDKLDRARVQATDRVGLITAAGSLIQQMVLAIGFCVSVFWFSPWMLGLLILCLIPAVLSESHFAVEGYALGFQQAPRRRELDYLRLLGASKESAKELKLFGLAPFLNKRFAALSDGIYAENVALAKRRLVWGGIFGLLITLGYYSAYAWAVWQATLGAITIATLWFLVGAIAGASTSLQSVFATSAAIADQALFLTDLTDFFAEKPKLASRPDALPAPRPIRDGVRFENVSFSYPGTSRAILQNLNCEIRPGERIALVGENGQGKTTLVKLITRLYDPTEGRILLDGVDLREYDPEDWNEQIAVIFQDFMRYDMTVRDNIAVGQAEVLDAQDADTHIQRAAELSLAWPLVDRFPSRLNQMLGRRFDSGVDLSGGEWQKIALARAYLRKAQLLILDEPTAALDAQAEFEVFERFSDLTRDRMSLLISHRFSTVRMADRILVLGSGRVIEEGTHQALVEKSGRYASMFELQAASYR